ncbi:FtsX-like permease family protein [Hazenella coriacea]|uniref:Putative ABC transport system permease protein n=1 Tax=Hazenella coriacea TaxID=1179467 RepID=A0A4R3KZY8_9BACL|nr:ABC transporter permease [Hazenella coriacea]TCS92391.1 putative ABC transport system permease protein [Hazenella coriacea]
MSWRICWRNLMRKKLRTFFTLFAIIFGVATVLAVISSVDTAKKMTEKQMQLIAGNADYSLLSTQYTFPIEILSKVKKVDGVSDASAVLYKQSQVQIANQSQLDATNNRVRLAGLSSLDNSLLQLHVLQGDLQQTGAILPETTANLWKANVGDDISFSTSTGLKTIPIAAVVKDTPFLEGPSDWKSAQGKNWRVIIPIAQLQEWYGLENHVQEIRIQAAPNAANPQLENQIKIAVNNPEIYLQPIVLDERQTNQLDDLYLLFYLIAGLAIFISGFILFNTLFVSVGERKKEFAIMKTIGFTPAQVGQVIMLEVLLLSALGTLIGIPLGIEMAKQLQSALFSSFNVSFSYTTELSLAIPLSLVTGLVIPIIAALFPVIQAGRVSVVYALKNQIQQQADKNQKWRLILGLLLLIVGVINNNMLNFLAIFASATLLFPFVLRLIRKWFSPVNSWILGYEGSVASQNVSRHINRTANMSAILSFGICLALFVTSAFESVNDSIGDTIRENFGGDLHLQLENSIDQAAIKQIQKIPGVAELTTYKEAKVLWEAQKQERQFTVMSVNQEWMMKHPLFTPEKQSVSDLMKQLSQPNTVILGKYAFSEWGGKVGETIKIRTFQGEKTFKVIGVVNTSKYNSYVAFTSDTHFTQTFGVDFTKDILLSFQSPAQEDSVRETLLKLYGNQIVELNTVNQNIERTKRALPGVNTLFNGLLFLAILISGIGIVNTLLMNVMERIREIGVMRSIGFTKGQVRKMILGEGLIIGVTGVISGLALGILLIYVNAAHGDSNWDMDFLIPWPMLILSSVLGICTSLIAALLPAHRANQMDLNQALKYE